MTDEDYIDINSGRVMQPGATFARPLEPVLAHADGVDTDVAIADETTEEQAGQAGRAERDNREATPRPARRRRSG